MSITIDKIAALLRKAESTSSEAEAEALIAKAQELATLTSIDIEMARSYVPKSERKEAPVVKTITMGKAGKKGLYTYVHLFGAIARANDVTYNIAQNSTYVVAYGFPSDIETVEILFSSLLTQMVQASTSFLRSGEYKAEMVSRPVYENDGWGRFISHYEAKPVHGHMARNNFQDAYASRIGTRLREAKRDAEAKAVVEFAETHPEYEASSESMALVLASKRDEVKAFYSQKSTARGSWKGGSSSSERSTSASRAGAAAANNARLSTPKGLGGSKGYLP